MYIYRLLITKTNLNQTNTDHHCPLEGGNTQSELHLVHNIHNIKDFKDYRLQIFEDLIEIHRSHNIKGEICKNIEEIQRFIRIS